MAQQIDGHPINIDAILPLCRVPSRLRVRNVKKYEPYIVSIGPFHRSANLRITEEHKTLYRDRLLERPTQGDRDINQAVSLIEASARKCYAENIDLSPEEFTKMMVLDGCFIIELFYRYKEYVGKTKEQQELMHFEDPIFSTAWIVRTLQRDLVLLENQIPFIVLESLFNVTRDTIIDCSLNELALTFLKSEFPCELLPDLEAYNNIEGHHLLHLIHTCLLSGSAIHAIQGPGKFPTWSFMQHSASDLQVFGVQFKKKKPPSSLFDITFTKCGVFKIGVLEIPPFIYGEGVTILLRNLIAMEQSHRQYKDHIASYAILLDSLINSKEDVKLLRGKAIMDVYWNEDVKIAAEIDSLSKGLKIDDFYYNELCVEVTAHCGKKWNSWRASLVHNHFHTPWAIISLIAGFIAIGLSITGTVYSILSYKK